MDPESLTVDPEEPEREAIRQELSGMSFEKLLQLKEELGSKVYNEAYFGAVPRNIKKHDFKRANKNRPREVSSKVVHHSEVISTKKFTPRDPRFDSLCGTFNKKTFDSAYGFIDELKQKEVEQLKEELKEEKNPRRVEKIQLLIQRLKNQEHEKNRLKLKEQKEAEERKAEIELLRQGKKPTYHSAAEKRLLNLVEKYEDLKSKGKVKKNIEKKRLKMKKKERKEKKKNKISSSV